MAPHASRIQYIDGIRFKRIMFAAAERLIENYRYLDEINVFPVPDGDTGSNMAGTMRSIVDGSAEALDESIEAMSNIIAEAALLGARGNSGVILAQFFCGFAEGVKDMVRVTPQQFADAMTRASERAIEAMSSPKEGTILTVITDWADHLGKNCHQYRDFPELLHDSLGRAHQSLKETTEKLASLKAAGVVDAGAQGFVYLLDGIVDFVERGRLDRKTEKEMLAGSGGPSGRVQERVAVEELTFRYCTECLVRGKGIDRDSLRTMLTTLGDSLIVAGTGTVVRVHVHTNEPETVFEVAERYGEVSRRKMDDMLKQHQDLVAKARQRVGIVTDSCCDLPEEFLVDHGIRFAPLTLTLDGTEYLDKVDITTAEFNDRLKMSTSAKTSQPAPIHFKNLYTEMLDDYEEVVSIHVVAGSSGTYQAAANMGRQVDAERVTVLNGNSVSVALGLIVREASLAAGLGMSATEVTEVANDAIEKVRVFVSMDTLDFAVRGGRMSKKQGMIAKALRIKPVLTFNREGKAEVVGKAFGTRLAERKLMSQIREYAKGKQNMRFAIAHVAAEGTAARYQKLIWNEFGAEPQFVLEASPVLGCYSGLGACAVAVLGD
ncbi:DegV family protein [Desulfovibrio ferrophilus]|uniref:DegV family protein n=1 Tax=Desulfovibrio ferrophilus TaxID=241368 RepID=A0A2Z6AUZ8_9BACT|nr:DegV family protein [Desulfovibrio ferrophilus]BBD07040.1 DegV family protein [Desulfovibrio ferrophilus]